MAVGAGKMMMHLFKVEFAIMMLQGICLKVEFVEFVIQILKKAAKLASEAEARRQERRFSRSLIAILSLLMDHLHICCYMLMIC